MGQITEVSTHIAAPPGVVYDLVADLPRMGRWSPECYRCDWRGGATRAVPGARFRGRNRRGPLRWSTTGTVVVAEPGRELTFDVQSLFGLPVARWSYRITDDGSGCTVTESTEDRRGRLIRSLAPLATGTRDRAARNAETMRVTLDRVRQAAEAAFHI